MHREYNKYIVARCDKCQAPQVTNGVAIMCIRRNCKNHVPYMNGCKTNPKPEATNARGY